MHYFFVFFCYFIECSKMYFIYLYTRRTHMHAIIAHRSMQETPLKTSLKGSSRDLLSPPLFSSRWILIACSFGLTRALRASYACPWTSFASLLFRLYIFRSRRDALLSLSAFVSSRRWRKYSCGRVFAWTSRFIDINLPSCRPRFRNGADAWNVKNYLEYSYHDYRMIFLQMCVY